MVRFLRRRVVGVVVLGRGQGILAGVDQVVSAVVVLEVGDQVVVHGARKQVVSIVETGRLGLLDGVLRAVGLVCGVGVRVRRIRRRRLISRRR